MNTEEWIENNTILKVYRGSHSYGTNHKDSDIDLGGVCIPPKDYIIGYHHFEQYENKNYTNFSAFNKSKQPAEIVIYGLHKFINLASGCNPNSIEYLFTNQTHILFINDFGKELIDNRHLFLSKKARHTFGGYAFNQLKRLTNKLPMEEYKIKLNNLKEKKKEYEIHIEKLNHQLESFNNKSSLTNEEAFQKIGIKDTIKKYIGYIHDIIKEAEKINYQLGGGNHNHHGSHKGIIDQHGYDTKHAMHLLRLLHMGLEILTEGECNVLRPDNNYLLAIRNGEYSLEYIQEEADRLFKLLDDAYVTSKLPSKPNVEKINDLLCDLTLRSFKR